MNQDSTRKRAQLVVLPLLAVSKMTTLHRNAASRKIASGNKNFGAVKRESAKYSTAYLRGCLGNRD